MRILPVGDADKCPCSDKDRTFAKCCKGKGIECDVFPDMEHDDGSIIPMFAVFKRDGSAFCIQPKKTFSFYIHPHIDLEMLNDWLSTPVETPQNPIPQALEQPLSKLKTLVTDDRPIFVSDGRSAGYVFMGTRAQAVDIIYKIWGHVLE